MSFQTLKLTFLSLSLNDTLKPGKKKGTLVKEILSDSGLTVSCSEPPYSNPKVSGFSSAVLKKG